MSGEIQLVSSAERAEMQAAVRRLDRLAHLMDEQFKLPLVGWRVGLDPLIGLIPGGGDWAAGLVGVYIFWQAVKLDAPRWMLFRMAFHIIVDLVGGYIPGVGDVFDAIYKSNRKNVDLLLEHFGARHTGEGIKLPAKLPAQAPRRPRWVRYLLALGISLALLALAALPFWLLWWWLNAR